MLCPQGRAGSTPAPGIGAHSDGDTRSIEPLREIEELVAVEGRWPGTDAERRAAVHLAGRLRSLGREAEIEPTTVFPNYAITHLSHAVMGVAGSVLSVFVPVAGVALLLFVALSAFGDLTGSFFLVRRLTGRRASQNVVSPERGEKPGTLVLVAHYDAAKTGALFNRRWLERQAVLGKLIRRGLGPVEPFFWSIIVVLVCAVLRLVGLEGPALGAVQFVPTFVLIVSVALLGDIALSGVVPGANDNASGLASVLRLAERHGGALEHFDLWVLFPGAEESLQLGMREWMRRHRREMDPRRTVFLNLDTVGHGTVRFMTREGFLLAQRYHPTLVALCRELAEEDEDDRFAARGYVSRFATDAIPARSRGFPAITITCLDTADYPPHYHQLTDTPERIDPEALDRAYEFCAALIERLDERVGPVLEDSSASRIPSSD